MKFRAWHTQLKEMRWDNVALQVLLDRNSSFPDTHNHLYVVMASTGVNDKFGHEIYEWDVVFDEFNKKYAEVKMNSFWRWSLYWKDWGRMNNIHWEWFDSWIYPTNSLTIFWNVYDEEWVY
jgi:hypothetical protein